MPLRNRKEGTEKRKYQPGEYSLNEPVAFPAPLPYLIDRDIAAGLTESSDSYDQKAYDYIHDNLSWDPRSDRG